MDQLKQGWDFVWKYRFWFGLGLAVIFASFMYFLGASNLFAKADARKRELEGIYNNVSKFTSGGDHPNPKWTSAAEELEQGLGKVVDSVWVELYKKQEPLFTWPKEVEETFKGRPFGADLTDKSNTVLITYRRAYDGYLDDEYYRLLNPLEADEDGKPVGVVEAVPEVLWRAVWSRTPSSMEAWYAQETFWVQRAILKAVGEANKNAKDWKEATIRRLSRIVLGDGALDSRTRLANPTLSAFEQAASTDNTATGANRGGGGNAGLALLANRYLEKNNQFRVIPVFVSMYVDQDRVQNVLALLSQADFGYTISQASVGVPEVKVELPVLIKEAGKIGKAGDRNDAAFNTIELNVWGTMRIYEMPEAPRKKYEEFKTQADKKETELRAEQLKRAQERAERNFAEQPKAAAKPAEKAAPKAVLKAPAAKATTKAAAPAPAPAPAGTEKNAPAPKPGDDAKAAKKDAGPATKEAAPPAGDGAKAKKS